jgi:hypothetical protein
MSTDFRGLRPASNDPMTQIIVELQKKLAKFITSNQVELIDSENEDIYSNGQDIDTVIKYHSFQSETHFLFTKDYYPPFEPDGQILTLDLKGRSLGNTLPDKSTFGNDASIYGDPILIDGNPFDPGIHTQGTKSIAMRLNRPTSANENEEYLQVPDDTSIQLTAASPGISIFTRFRVLAIDNQGAQTRTIFEKIDDSTPNNGIMLQVTETGRLVCIVKKAGTTTSKQTDPGTISITGPPEPEVETASFDPISFDPISFSTVISGGGSGGSTPPLPYDVFSSLPYDVFVTFANSGNVIHVYVNGVDQTLSTYTGSVNWHATLTNHDLSIFRRGVGSSGGYVYGDFYDFKYYKNKVVSQSEVTHHWDNKWTISDIDFGHVMVTNYWATFT